MSTTWPTVGPPCTEEASTASGRSLQKAMSPKEATEAISRNTKKLKRSPVICIPASPHQQEVQGQELLEACELSMKRRRKSTGQGCYGTGHRHEGAESVDLDDDPDGPAETRGRVKFQDSAPSRRPSFPREDFLKQHDADRGGGDGDATIHALRRISTEADDQGEEGPKEGTARASAEGASASSSPQPPDLADVQRP